MVLIEINFVAGLLQIRAAGAAENLGVRRSRGRELRCAVKPRPRT